MHQLNAKEWLFKVIYNVLTNRILFEFFPLIDRCFLFADMAWYQRKIASVIFASPPTSSYEEVSSLNYSLYFHLGTDVMI